MEILSEAPVLVLDEDLATSRRVAAVLWDRGVAVRIGGQGSEWPFDLSDPATWEPALSGVRAVLVTCHPDAAEPRSSEVMAEFAATAVRVGVRRLVLLSAPDMASADRWEAILEESGVHWTSVRARRCCTDTEYIAEVAAGALMH